jgi:TetR/AcrR family transcriptional regulator, regulator of cefoperazone and chloramphenicol sensitivity
MKRSIGARSGKMASRVSHRPAARSIHTRAQLIEAAGQVFAELGFDGATGQMICQRARVHTAAIVYHFDGMVGLYRAVMDEARRRLVTTEALVTAVKAQPEPRRQLEAFLTMIVEAVTSPASQTWAGRLFAREFVTPSTAMSRAQDRDLARRARLLKSMISALTGLPHDDPRVARSCISTMAPCAMLLLVNRRKLRHVFPEMKVDSKSAPQIARHLVDFALAGLAAISARN